MKVRWEDRHATNENHIEEGADITTCPPQEFYGGSAAQSSLLPFLDIMLGVEHDNKNGSYLTAMREYMYRPHREFLAHLERTTSTKTNIRQFLNHLSLPSPAADKVKAAYNECLEHLQVMSSMAVSLVLPIADISHCPYFSRSGIYHVTAEKWSFHCTSLLSLIVYSVYILEFD